MYVTFSISCDVLHCFWQGKTISYATCGEFLRPIKCEFRKRTPGGYFRLCVRVTMELRQNIPRRFTEEENTNLRRCLQAAFVWYVCNAVFAQNNFFLKCREESVQCLINRIYKFVTSHNFSVERHFCMVTPILFSHHKYFLNFSLSDKSKVIKSRHGFSVHFLFFIFIFKPVFMGLTDLNPWAPELKLILHIPNVTQDLSHILLVLLFGWWLFTPLLKRDLF